MILFCTRDAGPAEYMARIINEIKYPYECYGTYVSQNVFLKHGINCKLDFPFDNSINYSCAITSACVGDSLDNFVTKWAKENHIQTIAFVEHWSWMEERFLLGGERILADDILINDSEAQKNAIEAGIPKHLLHIVGNPVLEEKPVFSVEQELNKSLIAKMELVGHSVLFISEQLSDVFTKDSEQYLGYDEFEVLQDIISILGKDDCLIIKMHPEEKMDKYSEFLSKASCMIKIIGLTNEMKLLIQSSNVVIGMGSMLLLDAARYRTDILSYRPNQRKSFIGNNMGVTFYVKNKSELSDILTGSHNIENQLIGDRFEGSLGRIVNHITSAIESRI